jgi:EmrB/QacA subfamily drug resistance transporter
MTDRRAALIVSSAASFMTPFMSSSVTIALPVIGGEFAMDAVALGWVATSYLLAAAAFLLPFGRLADIHGRKRIFTLGLLVHSAASVLVAASPSGVFLIAARAAQGIGGAMVFGTGVAMLVSVYPPSERGRVLGINVAAVYLGLSLGPFAGGLLTQYFGWRSIFLVVAVLGACCLILVWRYLKVEWAEAKGERFAVLGTVLYSVSLTALMLGFSSLPGWTGLALTGTGLAGLAIFLVRESTTAHPILNTSLFRGNPVFAFANLAALINYAATFAVTFLLSLYLQYIGGLDPRNAGLVLVAQPLMMAVLSPLAGRLSDRVAPRIVASIGMGIGVAGLALCAGIGSGTPVVAVVLILALLGVGFALFSSPNTNAVMGSVERKHYSVAAATLGTMRLTGQMLSMGVVILVFASHIGKVRIAPAMYPQFLSGMHVAFLIFTGLSVLAVYASLVRGRARAGA